MTDPDSILKLGIDAARDGNKEEARNLFRLLTREDEKNVQAWLWLAGVAESQEERLGALERVIELDPQNEMAHKSLQSLKTKGEEPVLPSPGIAMSTSVPLPPEPPPPSPPPPDRYADMGDFDDPFAELDSLSDVFHQDPQAVGRAADTAADEGNVSLDKGDGGTTSVSSSASGSSGRSSRSQKEKEKWDSLRTSSSWVSAGQGSKGTMSSSKLSGSGNLVRMAALALFALLLIFLVGWFVWPMIFGDGGQQAAKPPTNQGQQGGGQAGGGQAGGGMAKTPPPPPQGTGGEAGGPAVGTPVAPTPFQEVPTATPEAPVVVPPAAVPAGNPAAANPSLIPPNTPLESNGWLYDFNQSLCVASCATPLSGSIGPYQTQGRFVHILVMVVNRTNQTQPVPSTFLVLKDAQGRVYNALPDVSKAFVQPGVNADISLADSVPANGIATSVGILFDVAPDATNLVLFAPSRPDQGWMVLQNVQ